MITICQTRDAFMILASALLFREQGSRLWLNPLIESFFDQGNGFN